MNDISKWAAEAGHEVDILTGQPDYNPEQNHPNRKRVEVINGIEVRNVLAQRSSKRGMYRNLLGILFVIKAAWIVAFGRKTDVVWSTSIPPVIQPALLRLACYISGAKFVYFPQDIYPEIAIVSGMVHQNGVLSRVSRRIDAWTLKRSHRVVTISNDMAEVLIERGAVPERVEVIRSFSPHPIPVRKAPENQRPVRFLFAGNLGRFQSLDRLVRVFAKLDPTFAQLEFLGEGREKGALQDLSAKLEAKNILFHAGCDPVAAQEFSVDCDVGIVTLMPEVIRYAFPAKTYTYLAVGLPILGVVDDNSEFSELLKERGIGECVDVQTDDETLSATITAMAENLSMYRAAVAERTADLHLPDASRAKWTRLFDELKNARN